MKYWIQFVVLISAFWAAGLQAACPPNVKHCYLCTAAQDGSDLCGGSPLITTGTLTYDAAPGPFLFGVTSTAVSGFGASYFSFPADCQAFLTSTAKNNYSIEYQINMVATGTYQSFIYNNANAAWDYQGANTNTAYANTMRLGTLGGITHSSSPIALGTWTGLAWDWDGSTYTFYNGNVPDGSNTLLSTWQNGRIDVGIYVGGIYPLTGAISRIVILDGSTSSHPSLVNLPITPTRTFTPTFTATPTASPISGSSSYVPAPNWNYSLDNTLAEDKGLYSNLVNVGAVPFTASPAPPYGAKWSGSYGNAQLLSSSAQMANDFDSWGTWTLYWQSVRSSVVGPGRYVLWSAGDPNVYISLESNGRIRYQYLSGSFFDSAASITAGTNYQLAVRYNGSNVRIYLGTSPGSTWTDIGTCGACPGNLAIGSAMYLGNYANLTTFGWPGYIAGWMGFNSALDSPPVLIATTPTPTPTPTPTATPSPSPSPSPTPIVTSVLPPGVFDNFEQPMSGGPWTGGPSPIMVSNCTDTAHTGLASLKAVVSAGTSYGHFFGINASSLQPGMGPMTNLGGATDVQFSFKVDQNINIEFHWIEGSTLGADGEDWAVSLSLTASPSWQTLTIPLAAFTTASAGNGVQDTQSILLFWVDYNLVPFVPYPAHTLYLDDIRFDSVITPTPTATPSPSPTRTPTATPSIPSLSRLIDDFDDGDYIGYNGGSSDVVASIGFGTFATKNLVGGSDISASVGAVHCSGNIAAAGFSPTVYLGCQIATGAVNISTVAAEHAITFSFKGDTPGVQIAAGFVNNAGSFYTYTFTIVDTNWHEMTLYFPDVTDPSLVPKLVPGGGAMAWSSAVTQIIGVIFSVVPSSSGSQAFGFAVDDLRFGEPASANSTLQVATALGVSVTQVNQAYSYQLDEQLTWIVLRLAAHCGCSVAQIMTMRETRSWGQVAIDVGTTWAAILAEVDAMTASLAPPLVDPTRFIRGLQNGPMPTPAPAPQKYVPDSPTLASPPSNGSCQ